MWGVKCVSAVYELLIQTECYTLSLDTFSNLFCNFDVLDFPVGIGAWIVFSYFDFVYCSYSIFIITDIEAIKIALFKCIAVLMNIAQMQVFCNYSLFILKKKKYFRVSTCIIVFSGIYCYLVNIIGRFKRCAWATYPSYK